MNIYTDIYMKGRDIPLNHNNIDLIFSRANSGKTREN
jgi:hypothetical protein